MVMEGNETLGGEHTMKYTDDILESCTPETYGINQYYHNKFNFFKE